MNECFTRVKPKEFKEWNEEMVKKYDPDAFHHHPNPIVRFIENKRVKTILKLIAGHHAAHHKDRGLLEVGCGAGRMTRVFAREFAHVDALDISPEMQRQAKEYLREFQNIRWVLADGATLCGVTDASADFTFSYLVLQHLPSQALATELLREILRTLKPGGLFLLQYNGARKPSMNWRGRAAWGVVNRLWSAGFHRAARATASAMHLDPEMVGKSWHGISLDSADVRLILESAGGQSLHFSGETTPMAWCWGLRGAGDGL